MIIALQVTQIILSIAITALVLLQAKGSGLGSAFGDSGGVYRTKRGAEKLLFQATILLGVVFSVLSMFTVAYVG